MHICAPSAVCGSKHSHTDNATDSLWCIYIKVGGMIIRSDARQRIARGNEMNVYDTCDLHEHEK